ncbi:MAG: GAF domain-containing sensor histidine kinase [Cyanobacteria bacterium P01_A01_bin.137]
MSSRFKQDSFQAGTIDSGQLVSPALGTSPDSSDFQSLVERILAAIQRGSSTQDLVGWVPEELVKGFGLQSCQIELYDEHQQTVTVVGGMGNSLLGATTVPRAAKHWEFYEPLVRGISLQFCSPIRQKGKSPPATLAWLGCAMMRYGRLLGCVWLARPSNEIFNDIELKQLQQIVSCVAISIHQTQLEETLEQQQTEIRQLRKAKDEFLQLISHELFIPLGSIQLSAQTLERIFKDVSWRKVPQRSTVLKVLSLLSQECRRQKQFVDNLITLMFPEYQKTSEPVLMNLSNWLPSLLRSFEARFEQESLNFNTNIPQEPLTFECDVAQLERVITELITNAIKYTPAKKTVAITVNADKTNVEIAIANTGVHIPTNHQPHIFEKFYRVPELDQRQYGGSGLGLAIVKQLVTNLDGSIELKSTKQKTTFTVKLPV